MMKVKKNHMTMVLFCASFFSMSSVNGLRAKEKVWQGKEMAEINLKFLRVNTRKEEERQRIWLAPQHRRDSNEK